MNYVYLLSRQAGKTDWVRRQSFGEHRPGTRTEEEAKAKASLAAIMWQRQEPDTEFRVDVTPDRWS